MTGAVRKGEGAMVHCDGPTVLPDLRTLGPDLRTFGLDLRTPHRRPIGPLSSYFPSSAGFARFSSNRRFSRTEQIC